MLIKVPLQLPDADIVFYPSLLDGQESDRLFTQLTEALGWRQDTITLYRRLMLTVGDRISSFLPKHWH